MRVTSIYTYPVKGCYRVEHDRAEVEPWGLAGDRRWMIVDIDTRRAVTQRDTAALTQVRPRPLADGLVLAAADHGEIVVPEPVDGEPIEVSVWGYTGRALAAGAAADQWLSAVLERKVRLVWCDDPRRRAVDPEYAQPGDTVSFADSYPLLLGNQGSLDALNALIDSSEGPLPMTRFRPNLVIADAPAWAEDAWIGRRIRVGEVVFRVPKPCDRCVVTTTDQETGVRGREPLRTLGAHRNIGQKLLFAVNLIPDNRGVVSVGDPVVPL